MCRITIRRHFSALLEVQTFGAIGSLHWLPTTKAMLSLTVWLPPLFWYEKPVTTLVTEDRSLDWHSCVYVLNASGLEEEEKE